MPRGSALFDMKHAEPDKHLFAKTPHAVQALQKQSRKERRAKERKAWYAKNREGMRP